jgi:acetolactate synthase-1/2/3 large subunit
MRRIKGAEALVEGLLREGVRYVFGIPGDQCGPITDAIYRLGRDAGLQFVTTRHEQAAAHMADAWARVTGQPGVCLGTVGPGVADLVPGVYTAWADSVPIVALGAQNQTWRSYPEHGSMARPRGRRAPHAGDGCRSLSRCDERPPWARLPRPAL